jgi:tubulin-specific chaperone B
MVQNFTVKLNASHSHMPNRLNEIRFDLRSTISEVKQQLERKFGTSSECMKLELRDSSDVPIGMMPDNDSTLGSFAPQENYTIHVIDDSGTAIRNEFEDVSKVEKYKISEKAFSELDGTFRKFKEANPSVMKACEENKIPEDFCKEEADKMEKD